MKSFQNIKKIKLNQQKEKWNLKNEIEIKKSKLEINQKKIETRVQRRFVWIKHWIRKTKQRFEISEMNELNKNGTFD